MFYGQNVTLHFGDRIMFGGFSFQIGTRDRVGLVGRNGMGKTTLLKTITGHISLDGGGFNYPKEYTLGYLKQEIEFDPDAIVLDEVMHVKEDILKLKQDLANFEYQVQHLTGEESDYEDILNNFSDALEHFQTLGGYTLEGDASKILQGLGFKETDLKRPIGEFSGGWQMRVELSKLLFSQPSLLLLDEPTNHLDIESIIWLENYLSSYEGSVVIISHDQEFLDQTVNKIFELDSGKIYEYKANYSNYLIMKDERMELQMNAFANQQKVIADKERTINRFMAKATKTKMAQSMQKQLNKIERITVDTFDESKININFAKSPRSGEVVLQSKNLNKYFDELHIIRDVDLKILRGERIAFVGQNGQGKTTLAKLLINKIEKTDGTVELGHNVQIGYYDQHQSDVLDTNRTVLETIIDNAPPDYQGNLRSVLGAFLFSGEDSDKKVIVLSGGERARLALACMLINPFNLLILDEPTNHLDMITKRVLKNALLKFDGTLIVISHDREFLKGLTEKVLEFRDFTLTEHLGDIDYFLERRNKDNMRIISLEKSADTETISNQKNKNIDQLNVLHKKVKTIEKEIERFTQQLSALDAKLQDPQSYKDPKIAEYNLKKSELQKSIDLKESEWMVMVSELENL